MKKKKWIIGGTVVALLVGGTFAVSAANNGNNATNTETGKMEILTVDEAKEIALANYEGVIDSIELERDRNWTYYDVDIDTKTKEVELDIDAYTGNILSVKEELRDDRNDDDWFGDNQNDDSFNETNNNSNQTEKNPSNDNQKNDDNSDDIDQVSISTPQNNQSDDNSNKQKSETGLSHDEAIKIAEQKTGAKVREIEKDWEHGRLVYEIELLSNTHEIEIKIDVNSGEIVKEEYDDREDDDWDDHNDDDDERE